MQYMKNLFFLVLTTALFSAFTAVAVYRYFMPANTVVIQTNEPAASIYASNSLNEAAPEDTESTGLLDFTETAERVTPGVVFIRSVKPSDSRFFTFDMPGSSGSGVIISQDGYIVTNFHVIEGSESIEVTLSDKREYKASVVGYDTSTDLALLKIDTENLTYIQFADSDKLRVGEWVIAVGNPFNLESTVTAGIVSAKGRNINILDDAYRIESFIQTDAVINPGNSGGALVNTRSGLVGINSAIITKTGKYEGYSFAIPSNLVRKVVRDLREFGVVKRGILGINIENLTQQNANGSGLKPGEGVVVSSVKSGSAAYEAGLRSGDIIYSINDQRTNSVPKLQEYVGLFRPGENLNVLYFRKGLPFETKIILKELVLEATQTYVPEIYEIEQITGLSIRELSTTEITKHGTGGALVQSVQKGSPAAEVNLEPGFIIKRINGKSVRDLTDVISHLQKNGKLELEGTYTHFPGEYKYIFKRQ
jgi:Do/DeqQ family serine protease